MSKILSVVAILITVLLSRFFLPSSYAQNSQNKERLIVRYKKGAGQLDKIKLKQSISGILSEKIDKLDAEVFEVPWGFLGKALEILLKNNKVLYAEKDNLAYAFAITNDPYLNNQWGLFKINAAGKELSSSNMPLSRSYLP